MVSIAGFGRVRVERSRWLPARSHLRCVPVPVFLSCTGPHLVSTLVPCRPSTSLYQEGRSNKGLLHHVGKGLSKGLLAFCISQHVCQEPHFKGTQTSLAEFQTYNSLPPKSFSAVRQSRTLRLFVCLQDFY